MGEEQTDRAGLLIELANLPRHPESVPINMLVKVPGTPMADLDALDPFEFIRTIAVARLMMPKSYVRLSAGREDMNEQMQAMAFMAGANSIFYCDKLLTTPNPKANTDMQLATLKRIADISGGELLSLSEFNKLATAIDRTPHTATTLTDHSLWRNGWVALLLIALMGCEWILRRRYDLP